MMLASMEILMTVVIVEISIVSLNASVVGIRLEARLCSGAESIESVACSFELARDTRP